MGTSAACWLMYLWYMSPTTLRILGERSARGEPFWWETAHASRPLRPQEVPAAERQIELRPDWTNYHVLLVLRRDYPAAYQRVTDGHKASTLCSALAIVLDLNDWGHLDQGGSYDDFAAQALLEVGPAALPYLRPLLDDRNPAWLSGSK